jgi:hypothetical protein
MVGNTKNDTTFHMILLISLKTSFLIIFLSFFIVCYFRVVLDTRGGPPHALSLLFTHQQGCSVCKNSLPSTTFQIPFKNLADGKLSANLKSAILQAMYLGGKLSPETAVFWPHLLPPIGQGSEFLRKNRHLECWLRQHVPNSFLMTKGHFAWCC